MLIGIRYINRYKLFDTLIINILRLKHFYKIKMY